MDEKEREERKKRFTQIASDPVADGVAAMIRPNQAHVFSAGETLEFMEVESAGFARLTVRTLKKTA